MALSSRLISTCSMSRGSSGTSGRSGGRPDVDAALAEALLDAGQRAADDLLEGLPVLAHADAAGLEPGHLEEIVHEAVQAVGLLLDRLGQLAPRRPGSRLPSCSTRALADPVMVASGVRRSCETALRSELRSRSVSDRRRACWASSTRATRSMARAVCAAKVSSRWSCSGVASASAARRTRLRGPRPCRAPRPGGGRALGRPGGWRCRDPPSGRAPAPTARRRAALGSAVSGASSPGPADELAVRRRGRNTATRLPKTSATWRAAARSSSSSPCWLTRSRVIA